MGQPAVDELSARYVAGYFDASGSLFVRREARILPNHLHRRYELLLEICNVDPAPLELLHELFGGSLAWKEKDQLWRWRLGGKHIERFLHAVWPYSLVKREQIDIAIKFRATYPTIPPKLGVPQYILRRREALAAALSHSRP